jgi:hypothetical protein
MRMWRPLSKTFQGLQSRDLLLNLQHNAHQVQRHADVPWSSLASAARRCAAASEQPVLGAGRNTIHTSREVHFCECSSSVLATEARSTDRHQRFPPLGKVSAGSPSRPPSHLSSMEEPPRFPASADVHCVQTPLRQAGSSSCLCSGLPCCTTWTPARSQACSSASPTLGLVRSRLSSSGWGALSGEASSHRPPSMLVARSYWTSSQGQGLARQTPGQKLISENHSGGCQRCSGSGESARIGLQRTRIESRAFAGRGGLSERGLEVLRRRAPALREEQQQVESVSGALGDQVAVQPSSGPASELEVGQKMLRRVSKLG